MANEPKWTPGPWRVEQGTTLVWGACNPDDRTTWGMGYPIIECRITPALMRSKRPDADEGEANAHLIASAPDLYAACERMDMFLDHLGKSFEVCGHTSELMGMVKSALAKARGE